MKKFQLLPIVICILIISAPTSKATNNEIVIYYEGFEVGEYEPLGWENWYSGDGNISTELSKVNPRNGSYSLHTIARPDGYASARLPLEIDYHESFGIDCQIFNVQDSASVKVTFDSEIINGASWGLTISYGPHAFAENQWWNGAYQIQINFSVGEWVRLDRDFAPDIAEAVSHPMSGFSSYNPRVVYDIQIYSWAYGGDLIFENYFDDLIITADHEYDGFIASSSVATQTTTSSVAPQTTQTSYQSQTSDFAPDVVIEDGNNIDSSIIRFSVLFIFVIGVIVYFKKFRNSPNNIKVDLSTSRFKRIPQNLICLACGSISELGAIFCGECGTKLPIK